MLQCNNFLQGKTHFKPSDFFKQNKNSVLDDELSLSSTVMCKKHFRMQNVPFCIF